MSLETLYTNPTSGTRRYRSPSVEEVEDEDGYIMRSQHAPSPPVAGEFDLTFLGLRLRRKAGRVWVDLGLPILNLPHAVYLRAQEWVICGMCRWCIRCIACLTDNVSSPLIAPAPKPARKKRRQAHKDAADEVDADGMLTDIKLVSPSRRTSVHAKLDKTADVKHFFTDMYVNPRGQRKRDCKLCAYVQLLLACSCTYAPYTVQMGPRLPSFKILHLYVAIWGPFMR